MDEILKELENQEITTLEGENICVLIDDDIAMHDLIKRTVKKAGMTLIGATNGEQGLNMIRESKPKLILLDEPTSALDADTRDTFMSLLMSIRDASDCTMIFASHDRSLMKYFDTEIELSEFNRAQKGKASRV